MAIGRVWRILWGTNNENVLDLNWPTVGDEPRFWRVPRDKSETIKVNSIQESWITGRDYYGALKARWFGMQQWAGATGMQAFLDNAADSNTFTIVPDLINAPKFQIPGCFLSSPFDKPNPKLEADGTQSVDLEFWNPAIDLGLAFRGLMFEYTPGLDITQPLLYTMTRTAASNAGTGGWYFGVDGLWHQAQPNVLRDRHYVNGVRSTLLEAAITNIVLNNRDLTQSQWTKTSVTAARDQVGVDGLANNASSIVATAGNGTCLQTVTLASSFRRTSCFVKRITGSGTIQMTTDNVTFTTITVTSAYTRVTIPSQTVTNPVIGFKIVTSGDKIAVDFVQSEVAQTSNDEPTSPIGVATTASTSGADVFNAPFAYPVQPMFVYAKWIEHNAAYYASGQSRIFSISAFGQNPRFLVDSAGSNHYGIVTVDGTGTQVQATPSVTPNPGDLVELIATIDTGGALSGQIAVNSGAPTSFGPTATNMLASTVWGNQLLSIASDGGGACFPVELMILRFGPALRAGDGALINTLALARTM